MVKTFEDLQKMAQEGVDASLKSLGAVSQGVQTLGAEVGDYTQKAFEDSASAMEKLLGARSLESAVTAQSDYVRAAYEGFIAQSTKIGALYADVAKDAYKPLESYLAKAKPAV